MSRSPHQGCAHRLCVTIRLATHAKGLTTHSSRPEAHGAHGAHDSLTPVPCVPPAHDYSRPLTTTHSTSRLTDSRLLTGAGAGVYKEEPREVIPLFFKELLLFYLTIIIYTRSQAQTLLASLILPTKTSPYLRLSLRPLATIS